MASHPVGATVRCGTPTPLAPVLEHAGVASDALLIRVRLLPQDSPRLPTLAHAWLDSASALRVSPDSLGVLHIHAATFGPHVLQIRALGYEPVAMQLQLPLPSDSAVRVPLRPAPYDGPCSNIYRPVPPP